MAISRKIVRRSDVGRPSGLRRQTPSNGVGGQSGAHGRPALLRRGGDVPRDEQERQAVARRQEAQDRRDERQAQQRARMQRPRAEEIDPESLREPTDFTGVNIAEPPEGATLLETKKGNANYDREDRYYDTDGDGKPDLVIQAAADGSRAYRYTDIQLNDNGDMVGGFMQASLGNGRTYNYTAPGGRAPGGIMSVTDKQGRLNVYEYAVGEDGQRGELIGGRWHNGDGTVTTLSVNDDALETGLKYETWDDAGNRVKVVEILDTDGDGKPDYWHHDDLATDETRFAFDNDGDGKPDEWVTYDENRNIVTVEDFDFDGVMDKLTAKSKHDVVTTYAAGDGGAWDPTRRTSPGATWDVGDDGVITLTSGSATLEDGTIAEVTGVNDDGTPWAWEYRSADGDPSKTRNAFDNDGDGRPDEWHWIDANGHQVGQHDFDGDGVLDFYRIVDGRMMLYRDANAAMRQDPDGPMPAPNFRLWGINEPGAKWDVDWETGEAFLVGGTTTMSDGTQVTVKVGENGKAWSWEYLSADGDPNKTRWAFDTDGDQRPDEWHWYDEDGHQVGQHDFDGDGVLDFYRIVDGRMMLYRDANAAMRQDPDGPMPAPNFRLWGINEPGAKWDVDWETGEAFLVGGTTTMSDGTQVTVKVGENGKAWSWEYLSADGDPNKTRWAFDTDGDQRPDEWHWYDEDGHQVGQHDFDGDGVLDFYRIVDGKRYVYSSDDPDTPNATWMLSGLEDIRDPSVKWHVDPETGTPYLAAGSHTFDNGTVVTVADVDGDGLGDQWRYVTAEGQESWAYDLDKDGVPDTQYSEEPITDADGQVTGYIVRQTPIPKDGSPPVTTVTELDTDGEVVSVRTTRRPSENVVTITTPEGQVTTRTTLDDGRVEVRGPDGVKVYEYDDDGQVVSVTGETWGHLYNSTIPRGDGGYRSGYEWQKVATTVQTYERDAEGNITAIVVVTTPHGARRGRDGRYVGSIQGEALVEQTAVFVPNPDFDPDQPEGDDNRRYIYDAARSRNATIRSYEAWLADPGNENRTRRYVIEDMNRLILARAIDDFDIKIGDRWDFQDVTRAVNGLLADGAPLTTASIADARAEIRAARLADWAEDDDDDNGGGRRSPEGYNPISDAELAGETFTPTEGDQSESENFVRITQDNGITRTYRKDGSYDSGYDSGQFRQDSGLSDGSRRFQHFMDGEQISIGRLITIDSATGLPGGLAGLPTQGDTVRDLALLAQARAENPDIVDLTVRPTGDGATFQTIALNRDGSLRYGIIDSGGAHHLGDQRHGGRKLSGTNDFLADHYGEEGSVSLTVDLNPTFQQEAAAIAALPLSEQPEAYRTLDARYEGTHMAGQARLLAGLSEIAQLPPEQQGAAYRGVAESAMLQGAQNYALQAAYLGQVADDIAGIDGMEDFAALKARYADDPNTLARLT